MKILRGTVRDDGKVFICYQPKCRDGQFWGTPEQLEAYRKSNRDRKRRERVLRKTEICQRRREKYRLDPTRYRLQLRKSYLQNRPKRLEKTRQRYNAIKETEEYRKIVREKQAAYLAADPLNRAIANSRSRVCSYLKHAGMQKTSKTMSLLGCDKPTLRAWLESKFRDGMTWDNYGKWHIDHVVPLSFAKNESDIIMLFHFSNLQPLWGSENSSKGDGCQWSSREEALNYLSQARRSLASEALEVAVKPVEEVMPLEPTGEIHES